ncbi:MAG: ferritin [Bacteroidota bacterium]|nr:ferritin [Bacteroidota bacterium]
MLQQSIEEALNQQVAKEAHASFSYLSMAVWCDGEGLEGCAKFFYRQSDEERMHMLKLIHYISEMDGKPIIPPIEDTPKVYASIETIFESTLVQEKSVTQSIHQMIKLAIQAHDYATENFLQWYVTEQREEETLIRKILDKIKLIGTGPQSLFYIDKEVARINTSIQNTTATSPEA